MKKYIFLLSLIVLAGIGAVIWWKMQPEVSRVKMHDAKISDIQSMVQLCTIEIYEEVPVKGTIDTRHFVARDILNGSISFDLDKIEMNNEGDTIFVSLPPEIVTIRESTAPGAYIVLDKWNDEFFGSDYFTTDEENSIKARAEKDALNRIYDKGYVVRARSEAVSSLSNLLESMSSKPVVVTDPSPEGYKSQNVK